MRFFVSACALAVLLGLPAARAQETPSVAFVDVTAAAGIGFKHDNARSPEKYLIETMGSGAAWLDYDNDGYLDLSMANRQFSTKSGLWGDL